MKTNTSFTDWISAKSKNPDRDIPIRVFEHSKFKNLNFLLSRLSLLR
jgi:hypothetical protein